MTTGAGGETADPGGQATVVAADTAAAAGSAPSAQVRIVRATGPSTRWAPKQTIPEMREIVRGRLAYALVGLLVIAVLSLIALVGWQRFTVQAASALLAPVIGVIGTVLGFYFGGKDN